MNKKTLRTAAIALAAATFIAGIGTMSNAATQSNGSDEALHFWKYDAQSVPAYAAPSTVIAYADQDVVTSASTGTLSAITCPASSTSGAAFLAQRGNERVEANWQASAAMGNVVGTGAAARVVFSEVIVNIQDLGSGADQAQASTLWSWGLACMSNGTNIDKVFYRHIETNSAGDFTAVATTDAPVATASASSTPLPTSGTVALSAATINSVQGALSLAIASPASTTFGTATLEDNKSTSTGALPVLTVLDERFNTKPGWDLKASVATFVNQANNTLTIDQKNLGIAPTLSNESTAEGLQLGTARIAGAINNYPMQFAAGTAGSVVGTSVLGGTLKLVAPLGPPAGTYTSTITFTLTTR
jgi:hypothetical protein